MSDFLGARLPSRKSPREVARSSSAPSPGNRRRSGSPGPSLPSLRALDWFVFFLADVQTGFGAFVSVYLTAEKWTPTDRPHPDRRRCRRLGGSNPRRSDCRRHALGALGDGCGRRGCRDQRVRTRRGAGLLVRLRVSDLASGRELRAGPGNRGDKPGLVGPSLISARLGRNAAFASVGSGLAAAGMGACAYYISDRAAFILVASMTAPALFALFHLRTHEIDPTKAHGGGAKPRA